MVINHYDLTRRTPFLGGEVPSRAAGRRNLEKTKERKTHANRKAILRFDAMHRPSGGTIAALFKARCFEFRRISAGCLTNEEIDRTAQMGRFWTDNDSFWSRRDRRCFFSFVERVLVRQSRIPNNRGTWRERVSTADGIDIQHGVFDRIHAAIAQTSQETVTVN